MRIHNVDVLLQWIECHLPYICVNLCYNNKEINKLVQKNLYGIITGYRYYPNAVYGFSL